MSKFDRKKFREELRKKEQEALDKDPYQDFEGSSTELFFLKLGHLIAKYKFIVLGVLIGLVLVLSIVIGVDEYLKHKFEVATIEIEKIEKSHSKDPSITPDKKIEDLENFLKEHDIKSLKVRVSKVLSSLYAEKKDFAKAAEYMEIAASNIQDVKEVQAYFYYTAGNYFENSENIKKAMESYSSASNLISENKELPNLNAMVLYGLARMKIKEGQKDSAISDLKKILEIESKYEGPILTEIKQTSTYLILKLNKG